MEKRQKAGRKVRLSFFKDFYGMYKAGMVNIEQATQNVAFTGHVIFKSELDKFQLENPDINMQDFTEFVTSVGALRTAGRVVRGQNNTRLSSKEKANSLGIAEADYSTYTALVDQMQTVRNELKKLITDKSYAVSFAITRSKKTAPNA